VHRHPAALDTRSLPEFGQRGGEVLADQFPQLLQRLAFIRRRSSAGMRLGRHRPGQPSPLEQLAQTRARHMKHRGDLALTAVPGVVGLKHPLPYINR